MRKKEIGDALRELAEGADRSIKARIEEIYEDIEATLSAGVKREKVVEKLNEEGFEISQSTFNTTLTRIRKERQAAKDKPSEKPKTQNQASEKSAIIRKARKEGDSIFDELSNEDD